MKKLFIFLLLINYTFLKAQSKPSQTKTLPGNSTVQKKGSGASTESLVNNLMRDTCLDKKFSIVFYLINDSAYALTTPSTMVAAMATYSLGQIMSILNTAFKPICVQFEHCKTVIIPDYEANKWKITGIGADVIRSHYEKNVINVYLPDGILPAAILDQPEPSYTYLPPVLLGSTDSTDIIVIERTATTVAMTIGGFQGSCLLHVFGHYFGLPHTYQEKNPGSIPNPPPPTNVTPSITTLEYVDHVNIQNCLDHGDGFCDTEADPYGAYPSPTVHPTGSLNKCADAWGMKDGHGDFYILPYDNFMSHYVCRCIYSQQQLNFMAYMILTRRLYLH